jgi:hypothetical protein
MKKIISDRALRAAQTWKELPRTAQVIFAAGIEVGYRLRIDDETQGIAPDRAMLDRPGEDPGCARSPSVPHTDTPRYSRPAREPELAY